MNSKAAGNGSDSDSFADFFERDVRPEELAAVRQRSAAATRPAGGQESLPDFDSHLSVEENYSPFFERTRALLEDPDQEKLWQEWAAGDRERRHPGLTGLAFSGGGVRSSTINLGIVQVLHRIGLFRCIDYLSTVSGGGYVGSSLSSCYSPREPETAEDSEGEDLQEALRRTHEEFPYQHVRGRPEPAGFLQLRNYSSFLVPRGFVDYLKFPVLLLRGVIVNFLVILPWIVGAALVSRIVMTTVDDTVTWVWTTTQWPFRVTIYVLGLFLLLAILFPITRRAEQVLSGHDQLRRFRRRYESLMVAVLVAAAGAGWVELQPVALNQLRQIDINPGFLASSTAGAAGAFAAFGNLFAKRIKSLLGQYGLYLVALLGLLAFWLLYLLFCEWLLEQPSWWQGVFFATEVWVILAALLIALFIYTNLFIDANGLSMHNFYRDRLAKAFLFRVDRERDVVEPNIGLRFSELSRRLGPLHIVNVTLNTEKLPTPFRKGRRAEAFSISPLHTGSRITGYCKTEELERRRHDLDVSMGVATSGAAVSSNMGMQTNVALRFILSILNVRLGYWLMNPRLLDPARRSWIMRLDALFGVGVVRFLQELTGRLRYDASHVYLSDGGHFENLAIYELVRRQCRLIVVGDGECDPRYEFNGLTEALRLIQIDFGIRIEMDGLDEIRSGEQQFARGTIDYPGRRTGYLIYLKSSLLGDDMVEATVSEDAYVSSPLRSDVRRYDELTYMARYKAENTDFPHESTADQFFDETQFECYRALGYLIADRAFTGSR